MDALNLKDIHLPEPVGWWPPAPGWWLAIGLLALLAWGLRRLHRRFRRRGPLRRARQLLDSIRRSDNADRRQVVAALSELLKRVAISIDGRQAVAALNGEAWLAYLDKDLPGAPFSQGPGRCLADAPYRPQVGEIDLEALFELCERWLKQRGKAE